MKLKKNTKEEILPLLNHGDLISVFNPGLFGQLRKVITRRSFTRSALYLDINGTPMIVTDHKGRLVMMYLGEFLELNPYIVSNSTEIDPGFMRQMLHELGSKQKASYFVARILNISKTKNIKPDEIYHHLNN